MKVGAEISFGDNGKGEPLLTATVVREGEMGVRDSRISVRRHISGAA